MLKYSKSNKPSFVSRDVYLFWKGLESFQYFMIADGLNFFACVGRKINGKTFYRSKQKLSNSKSLSIIPLHRVCCGKESPFVKL